jgi:hypothetical protein
MLRRNPTRLDASVEDAENRELLRAAREAREITQGIEPGVHYHEGGVKNSKNVPKTTAERIGYAPK